MSTICSIKDNVVNVGEDQRKAEFYINNQVNSHIGSYVSFDKIVQNYTERELSNHVTNYKISGLKPGTQIKTSYGPRAHDEELNFLITKNL